MKGGDPSNGQGLKEEVKSPINCGWRVFYHQVGYPVWARSFMIGRAAKGLQEDSRGDLSDHHCDRGGESWLDVAKPREWCARKEYGVRGESCRLH